MLTIISVSYNSQHILTQCLAAVIDSEKYPIIIVDNASSDDSAKVLQARFPKAQVEALSKNIGYGRAANVGLDFVQTRYALLLNPDLKADTAAIDQLLQHAAADDSDTAIWGPASLAADHQAQSQPENVEWLSGCAMLFDMQKLQKIGLFDENIFLFFEETDLCQRVLQVGMKIKLCKDVYFDHMLGQACRPTPKIEAMKAWHYGWSRCYYINKHIVNTNKRLLKQQYRQYKRKQILSLSPTKRSKYKYQAAGTKAFISGTKAFKKNGTPQMAPHSIQ